MKEDGKMTIKHFGGIEIAKRIEELCEILHKRYGDDVNEFWITYDNQENPCLVILINKGWANVTYFPDAESLGFQSVGNPIGLNPGKFSVFYTNNLKEKNRNFFIFEQKCRITLKNVIKKKLST